jgi:hypothetical protein
MSPRRSAASMITILIVILVLMLPIALATSRMMTRGFAKRRKSWTRAEELIDQILFDSDVARQHV